jgi:hypothetical protein
MEVLILEALAAVFLLLSVLRPVLKGLWALDGIVLLPVLALGIIIGIFPAYGFRPECIPLLVFAVFLNIVNFAGFCSLFTKVQNDDYRDKGLLFTVICLALFGFSVWIVWKYSPPMDFELNETETLVLEDRSRNEELWLRIYIPESAPDALRPLVVLVPPAAGSVTVIDAVCAGLRDKGFTVLSYSRPGFDSPAVDGYGSQKRLVLSELYRLGNVLIRGLVNAAANEDGKVLEESRKKDIVFLLRELSQNKALCENIWAVYHCNLNQIPLWIIGKPGSSKSLAVNLVTRMFVEKSSNDHRITSLPNVYFQTYMCSSLSRPEAIMSQLSTLTSPERDTSFQKRKIFIF